MASHSKKSREFRAHLALIDETGLMMAPLVRRSLAFRGQTPILQQKGAHRDRLSVIAALSYTWRGEHPTLSFQTCEGFFDTEAVGDFVRDLSRYIRGSLIVIWDQAPIHKGPVHRNLLEQFPRLSIEYLPPYAPELNPVESLWNYLKYDELVNFAPIDVADLNQRTVQELTHTVTDRHRLDTFQEMSELPLKQAKLET